MLKGVIILTLIIGLYIVMDIWFCRRVYKWCRQGLKDMELLKKEFLIKKNEHTKELLKKYAKDINGTSELLPKRHLFANRRILKSFCEKTQNILEEISI